MWQLYLICLIVIDIRNGEWQMMYGIYKTNRCNKNNWHNPIGLYYRKHNDINDAFKRAENIMNVFKSDYCSCIVEVREYDE